eukprot:scaffold170385_cov48-Prasinocladus_malaysianus.AAC.1
MRVDMEAGAFTNQPSQVPAAEEPATALVSFGLSLLHLAMTVSEDQQLLPLHQAARAFSRQHCFWPQLLANLPIPCPMEIYVDDEAKLTLHGLVQHYIMLEESDKNRKLNDLLDALDFNQ